MLMIEISAKEYERMLNWDDAMMYCSLLVIDGKNDWRMPTIVELKEIYHSENDFSEHYYWSSSHGGWDTAWGQDMSGGCQYYNYKDGSHYVRIVRSI